MNEDSTGERVEEKSMKNMNSAAWNLQRGEKEMQPLVVEQPKKLNETT